MPVKNGIIGITEIEFKAKDTMRGAWVNVEKVDTLPKTVKTIPRRVYSNIKITENNVQKYLEGKAIIKFKVLKSWLAENEISSDNIALYRYKDDKWYGLSTTALSSDETYQHYSAETEGFSYFIIGEETPEKPAEITEGTNRRSCRITKRDRRNNKREKTSCSLGKD
jgi:PGF-pre-PGF domain-containing protein